MAKKHKGKTERSKLDFYPTPPPLCLAICRRLDWIYGSEFDYIVEPSAGSGNFVEAARSVWVDKQIHAIELRPEERDNCIQKGASSFTAGDWPAVLETWKPGGRALVVGNPPFSVAATHIQAALSMSTGTIVAFLLKMNFFGGKARAEWFWPFCKPTFLIPIVGRPSFTTTELASNDTNEYGLFVWEAGPLPEISEILFPHITWK